MYTYIQFNHTHSLLPTNNLQYLKGAVWVAVNVVICLGRYIPAYLVTFYSVLYPTTTNFKIIVAIWHVVWRRQKHALMLWVFAHFWRLLIDIGFKQNTCLHSGLLQKPQVPMLNAYENSQFHCSALPST